MSTLVASSYKHMVCIVAHAYMSSDSDLEEYIMTLLISVFAASLEECLRDVNEAFSCSCMREQG
jgi:hypothetical protein